MEYIKEKSAFNRRIAFWLLTFLMLGASSSAVAYSQFLESFGDIGTVKNLKGQIRDGFDDPIPLAMLQVTHFSTDKTYSIQTDKKGRFDKKGLPPGKYKITIRARGYNVGEYTANINPKGRIASKKYSVVRLSPGCSSGDSGVILVNKISDPFN